MRNLGLIFLSFQECFQCGVQKGWIRCQIRNAQSHEGSGEIEHLGHAGHLFEILIPERLHKPYDLPAKTGFHAGTAGMKDRKFCLHGGVADMCVKAPPTQRI